MTDHVRDYLIRSRDAVQHALDDPNLTSQIHLLAEVLASALDTGHKVLLCGNGGSAGDAQHLAGELVGSFRDAARGPLAAIALTTDSSVLTAIANDSGYERVFSRQVEALGQPGDVLIAISTSGRSPSVLHAIDAARDLRLIVIGLTGRGGESLAARCHHAIVAPSNETPIVQQFYLMVGHLLCGLVEARLFPEPPP